MPVVTQYQAICYSCFAPEWCRSAHGDNPTLWSVPSESDCFCDTRYCYSALTLMSCMKSDINPQCPVWKLRMLRTIVHRGARVPVNKCVQPSWVLSWPHSLGHECACWTRQFSSSQQLITDKMMKEEMSVCAGGAKLCLLALSPAQVWPHGHSCPAVAAEQPGCPWCSVAIPECSGTFIPVYCGFGARTVWRCDEPESHLHCWMKM